METYCGANCNDCPNVKACKGCKKTCGRPYGGSCIAAEYIKVGGIEAYNQFKEVLISEINELLKIEGIPTIDKLYELCGSFVNLDYPLNEKMSIKFLDNNKIYLGNQIEIPDTNFCYGIVADNTFIIIGRYMVNGENPELVIYKKR